MTSHVKNFVTALILVTLTYSPILAMELVEPEQKDYDRTRYIDIDEIESGMTGYGMTVFHGTKIEKFDIVVVSVMKNRRPKQNAIVIKTLDNKEFELARGVQGVSGSPVYIDGRLAGAMSFGWSGGVEPLYGVTPILEMLDARQTALSGLKKREAGQEENTSRFTLDRSLYNDLFRETLLTPEQLNEIAVHAGLATPLNQDKNPQNGLVALPLTVSLSTPSNGTIEEMKQFIPGLNMTDASSGRFPTSGLEGKIKLEPGSSLTVPLISGDMGAQILGTVTEVVDNQVYGFGHGWNSTGAAQWPMGTGYIHTFVALNTMSFKLGQYIDIVGTLMADENVAVYGEIGKMPPLIPITAKIDWPYIPRSEEFKVNIAMDDEMSSVLAAQALLSLIAQRGGLPIDHSIKYNITMNFNGAEPLVAKNLSSMSFNSDLIQDTLTPLTLMINNPWKKVTLKSVDITATVMDTNNVLEITQAQINNQIFKPGQTITASVQLESFRGENQYDEISLTIPENMPEGKYPLLLGSYISYMTAYRSAWPHKSITYSAEDVHDALQDRLGISRSKLYMILMLPDKGLAISGEELPSIPGSKALVLTDTSRKLLVSPFTQMKVSENEIDHVIFGRQNFTIEVRKD